MKKVGVNCVILNMDPNYQWVLVGEPCRSVAWFNQANGSKRLEHSVIAENIRVLEDNGYKLNEKKNELIYAEYPENCPTWIRHNEEHKEL